MGVSGMWNERIGSGVGLVITPIDRVDSDGCPWVCIRGKHIPAIRTTAFTAEDVDRAFKELAPVVVAPFDEGQRVVILGFLEAPVQEAHVEEEEPIEATVDGRRVTLRAKDEVVLQCGKASITLTRAGKIMLRGTYISSRSSGVNTLKGGSVQIN